MSILPFWRQLGRHLFNLGKLGRAPAPGDNAHCDRQRNSSAPSGLRRGEEGRRSSTSPSVGCGECGREALADGENCRAGMARIAAMEIEAAPPLASWRLGVRRR